MVVEPDAELMLMTPVLAADTRPVRCEPAAMVITPPAAEVASMAAAPVEVTLPLTVSARPPVPEVMAMPAPVPPLTAPLVTRVVEPAPVEVAMMPLVVPLTGPVRVALTAPPAPWATTPAPLKPVIGVPPVEVSVTAPAPVDSM